MRARNSLLISRVSAHCSMLNQAAAGIDAGWLGRAPIYNLYHLLNHLNLFGAGYLEGMRGMLQRV